HQRSRSLRQEAVGCQPRKVMRSLTYGPDSVWGVATPPSLTVMEIVRWGSAASSHVANVRGIGISPFTVINPVGGATSADAFTAGVALATPKLSTSAKRNSPRAATRLIAKVLSPMCCTGDKRQSSKCVARSTTPLHARAVHGGS